MIIVTCFCNLITQPRVTFNPLPADPAGKIISTVFVSRTNCKCSILPFNPLEQLRHGAKLKQFLILNGFCSSRVSIPRSYKSALKAAPANEKGFESPCCSAAGALTRSCPWGAAGCWRPASLTALGPPRWAAAACWTSPRTSSLWTRSPSPSGNTWIWWFCPQISKSSFRSSRPLSCDSGLEEKRGVCGQIRISEC